MRNTVTRRLTLAHHHSHPGRAVIMHRLDLRLEGHHHSLILVVSTWEAGDRLAFPMQEIITMRHLDLLHQDLNILGEDRVTMETRLSTHHLAVIGEKEANVIRSEKDIGEMSEGETTYPFLWRDRR